jgi:hypothetical protein
MMALSGAVPLIFGGESALLLDFWKFLHVCAALYRHFVRRDGLLWRMWFSRVKSSVS